MIPVSSKGGRILLKAYLFRFVATLIVISLLFSGCSHKDGFSEPNADTTVSKADTSGMDFSFDDNDLYPNGSSSGQAIDVSAFAESTYSITSGGTYTLSGEKTDTMVLIDADGADVNLILRDVTIRNSNGPAIYVRSADKVTITLEDGTVNTLSDGASYSITDSGSTLDAAVFSKADLTVNGSGTLVLEGNYKHGVVSKDDLIISSGTLQITAQKAGLVGKDCVKIHNGKLTVSAGSDGIRSDNDEDVSRGYIYLRGGTLRITAGNDGIQAETVLKLEDVDLTIQAGGGSSGTLSSSDESYKGLKAGSDLYITGGIFDIDAKDDCIHSNGTITISGGTYTLSSGDDGIHADTDLEISGSATKITITKSYEGIEATNLYIKDGEISIVAADDGLNAAGGSGSSGGGGMRPGMGQFSASTGTMVISGGNIYIKMGGDGVDANGSVTITGGNITVSGANSGDTSILDFDTTGTISGGTFIGTGASGMAQNFSASSTQGAIMVTTGTQAAGTTISLTDSDGKELIKHTADQPFSCVIISHASIVKGGTYTLTAGSSSTTITMTDTVYGSGGGFGRGPGGGFGGGGPDGGPGGRR